VSNGGSLSVSTPPVPGAPGGALPDIPQSSLLNTPAAGDIQSQINQGQNLLNQVQTAAGGGSGAPAAQAALIKAATTTLQNATSGLPRAIITDVAGVATGFAMGGPVGGIVAAGSAVVGLLGSLFSGGPPPVFEGWQSEPSQASSENFRKLQYYISQPNIIGATQSNLPPGWYLSAYLSLANDGSPLAKTFSPSEMFAQTKGTYQGGGSDPYASELMSSMGSNAGNGPAPNTLLSMRLADFLGGPGEQIDSRFADAAWFFMWADPSGQNLPGALQAGFVTSSGAAALSALPPTGGPPWPGPNTPPSPATVKAWWANARATAWRNVLDDITPHSRLSRDAIAKSALRLMPDPMWWETLLYTQEFFDSSGNFCNYLFQLDLQNAMATVLVMATSGAHSRAITSELLMQAAVIRNYGGPSGSPGTLTGAHQEFLDQWFNIAVGKRPGAHHPATKPAKNKTVRKTAAAPLRSATKAPKLLAPVSAPAGSSPFLQPAFLYPAAGVGGALALYAGYRYLRR
jgi:hypothetical protein